MNARTERVSKVKKLSGIEVLIGAVVIFVLLAVIGVFYYFNTYLLSGRWALYAEIRTDPVTFNKYSILPGTRCEGAPFAFPTHGVPLGLWDQSYHFLHRHAGVDIFSGTEPGITPVYAVYPGYLTRLADRRASVIIRIPSNPLNPGTQIWTYYTHLANENGESFISADFPAGISEKYVEAGTLLGYMGNFSGHPGSPTGLHLHFSVVKDDGKGQFLNELRIENTYDPSPYFNLQLNNKKNRNQIPVCQGESAREHWNYIDE